MSTVRARSLVVLVVSALLTVGLLPSGAAQEAQPPDDFSAVLVIDAGIGFHPFEPEHATYRWADEDSLGAVHWDDDLTDYISVGFSSRDGSFGREWDFHPAEGERLTTGHYPRVMMGPSSQDHLPAMRMSEYDGCEGELTIRELDRAANRLWMTFAVFCEGKRASAFGEIRFNVPAREAVETSPSVVAWPAYYRGQRGRVVAVRLTNRSDQLQSLGRARTRGDASFRTLKDDCSVLAPGEHCEVRVRVEPQSRGPLTGRLEVPRADAPPVLVPLRSRGIRGHTGMVVRTSGPYEYASTRDDFVDVTRDSFQVGMVSARVLPGVGASAYPPSPFSLEFHGTRNRPGWTPGKHKRSHSGSSPYSWCDEEDRLTWTVHEAKITHGRIRRLRMDFRHTCNGHGFAPMYGSIAWRASAPPSKGPPRLSVRNATTPRGASSGKVTAVARLEKGFGPRRVALVLVKRDQVQRIVKRVRLRGGERTRVTYRPRGLMTFMGVENGGKPIVSDLFRSR